MDDTAADDFDDIEDTLETGASDVDEEDAWGDPLRRAAPLCNLGRVNPETSDRAASREAALSLNRIEITRVGVCHLVTKLTMAAISSAVSLSLNAGMLSLPDSMSAFTLAALPLGALWWQPAQFVA